MQQLSESQLTSLRSELSLQNQQHRFIIVHLRDRHQGSFFLITDHQRLAALRAKHDTVTVDIVQDILPVTNRLAYWAVSQQQFTSQPWDLAAQQSLLECTNAVLQENRHASNDDFPWRTPTTFDHPAEQ